MRHQVIRLVVKWNLLHDCESEGKWRMLERKSNRQGSESKRLLADITESHCNAADNSFQVRLWAWGAAGPCCHSFKVTISRCQHKPLLWLHSVLSLRVLECVCVSDDLKQSALHQHWSCSHESGKINWNKSCNIIWAHLLPVTKTPCI